MQVHGVLESGTRASRDPVEGRARGQRLGLSAALRLVRRVPGDRDLRRAVALRLHGGVPRQPGRRHPRLHRRHDPASPPLAATLDIPHHQATMGIQAARDHRTRHREVREVGQTRDRRRLALGEG